MTLEKAIEILETWYRGGYATQIEDMNPAVKLGIEALKVLKHGRLIGSHHDPALLPGETQD